MQAGMRNTGFPAPAGGQARAMAAKLVRRLMAAALFAAGIMAGAAGPGAADEVAADNGAVVIMYHRVGDSRYPSTNVTIEQFEAHLKELEKKRYTVLPLAAIVDALQQGKPLPQRAVAITFDDAYRSILDNAVPLLKARGFPFTLFVATDPVDRGLASYLSWDDLRALDGDELAAIGSQTATHPHLPLMDRAGVEKELAVSQARFKEELGRAPDLIAYPYGEYGAEVKAAARAAGFRAGFGQHSGAIGRTDDIFGLPRFAFNEAFADMQRFTLAANAKALPVTDITPADPFLDAGNNPPNYGFTMLPVVEGASRLACYASGLGKVRAEVLGPRVEVRFDSAFPAGRTRVNCTMPELDGRWRWLGRQFLVAPSP